MSERHWSCPACGTSNPVSDTSCEGCGRWASVFDLERVDEADEQWVGLGGEASTYATPSTYGEPAGAPAPAPAPAPVGGTAEKPANVKDLAQVLVESMRGDRNVEGDVGAPEPSRAGGLLKWIGIALFVLWIVLPQLIDALT